MNVITQRREGLVGKIFYTYLLCWINLNLVKVKYTSDILLPECCNFERVTILDVSDSLNTLNELELSHYWPWITKVTSLKTKLVNIWKQDEVNNIKLIVRLHRSKKILENKYFVIQKNLCRKSRPLNMAW